EGDPGPPERERAARGAAPPRRSRRRARPCPRPRPQRALPGRRRGSDDAEAPPRGPCRRDPRLHAGPTPGARSGAQPRARPRGRGASPVSPRLALRWLALGIVVSVSLVVRAEAQPVQGYVDLHSHLTAEMAFGGGWFWGTIEGPIDWAVRRCDGN